MATVVSVITGLAVTLQLTRALYIGLVVGLLVALLLWSRRVVPDARRLRRRFALVTLGTIVSIAATALLAPELLATSAVQAVVDNASQGLASLTGGQVANNTFQYRIGLAQSMIGVLGGHWLFGLGFLHPSTVYFAQLPGGSIRNADVGVLNGVMTMGVLGTLCIYFPVLVGLRATWRAARREDAWSRLALGAMMWLISILVASVTLTTLFSTTGLVLVAVMIGLLVRVSADNTDGRAASSASGPGAI
jgi:hypothetical protein